MAGEGLLLREARHEKGWSLERAEEITKIRVRYLEAVEEENYAILPGPTYVKGFLRNYAKHLGLNPEQIITMYKASESAVEVAPTEFALPTPKAKPTWLRPLLFSLAGLLVVATVMLIVNFAKPGSKDSANNFTPVPLPSSPPIEKTPSQSPPQSTVPAPAPAVAAVSNDLKVVINFSQTCWLVIKADGKPALEGTFPPGTSKEILAKETVEFVTVGNAGGIALTVNGKPYHALGTSGQVVRNIIIKKDGTSSGLP